LLRVGHLPTAASAGIPSANPKSSHGCHMNVRFAEVDRKLDQINAVLMDHSDRLARIETSLDISGRPLNGETSDIAEP